MQLGKSTKSLVIIGASGVGKGTIINHLREKYPDLFSLVLSYTTRKPRPGEEHGVNYYYVSHGEFNSKIPQMLEYKLVHKNWYGTSLAHLDYLQSLHKIPILDVDIQGMMEIKNKINCQTLCILPPTWSVLRSRLEGRRTQTKQVVEARMQQNVVQVQKMLKLKGCDGITFTTNFQYQLTTYGIEKWLAQNFARFLQAKREKHEKQFDLFEKNTIF